MIDSASTGPSRWRNMLQYCKLIIVMCKANIHYRPAAARNEEAKKVWCSNADCGSNNCHIWNNHKCTPPKVGSMN